MQPRPLTEAEVRRIVREELRAMGFGEGRLRDLISEELMAAMRRADERSRWLLQHEPSMVPAEEERRLREAFADAPPQSKSAPQAALGTNADGRQRAPTPANPSTP